MPGAGSWDHARIQDAAGLAGTGEMCQEPGHGGSQRALADGASRRPRGEERQQGPQGREEPLREAQASGVGRGLTMTAMPEKSTAETNCQTLGRHQ